MDKLGQVVRRNFIENYYRLLSVTHLTVNKVARPTAQKMATFIEEQVKTSPFISSPNPNPNTGISDFILKNIRDGILIGNDLALLPLNTLGNYLDESLVDVERRLQKEYGVNTNQWVFSLENLIILQKISQLADITLKEVSHINSFDTLKYLSAWSILQGLYMSSYEKQISSRRSELDFQRDSPKLFELRQIQEELLYFSTFAHGPYGKVLNTFYRDRPEILKLLRLTDFTQDFVSHTRIEEADVLHCFWDSTPYKPAFVIAREQFKRSIVLCMRGTRHWADAITDLDFHYLKFSIMKDPYNENFFIKYHFREDQEYLKQKLGEDTREINGGIIQPLTGKEEPIVTGYTHAGMFLSAIGAYHEVTHKLEEIFSKPEHQDFSFSITGHSLGGGMSTLMVLLYLVHPLKALKDNTMNGYSYGGASVLSEEFDKYMKPVMKSFILGDDIVPRLSYGSITDVCKIILAFDEINKKDPKTLDTVLKLNSDALLSNKDEMSNRFIEFYENFKRDHMTSRKLLPMGRVFHMQDVKAQPVRRNQSYYDFVLREISDKKYFDEMIFTTQVIKHHFPSLYEEGLVSSKVLFQNYLAK